MSYKYKDVVAIDAYQSTPWLVKFSNGCLQLHVWHKKAKIEDIVAAVKMQHPGVPFTVGAVDVGTFTLHHIDQALSNARLLNQDMEVVIE